MVKAELHALSRNPFRRVLSDFLGSAPSPGSIAKAARKAPDRWAQSLSIIAKLSGYSEKLEVEGSLRTQTMSDAEIDQKIQELVDLEIQSRQAPEPPRP